VVSRTVLEARRQRAADGIALAIGELGLQNARRAGSQEHTHTPPAPALGRLLHGLEEAVLLQRQFGQPVVPALELAQILRQPRIVHAGYFANVGLDVHGLEFASVEAAALLAQALQGRRRTFADATGRRKV